MNEKPSESELQDVASDVGSSYYKILIKLGISTNKIEGWKLDGADSENICFKGLVYWRKGNGKTPVTWTTLLIALQESEQKEYAKRKEEELVQEKKNP